MPITPIHLQAFDGPNRLMPQAGVWMQAQTATDVSAAMRDGLKDAAQRAGMILARLRVQAQPADVGIWLHVQFATPEPQVGAALARMLLDRVLHPADNAEDDLEEALVELARQRRAQAIPVVALQAMAEAAARGIPAFIHNETLQIGYGARGWATPLVPLRDRTSAGRISADMIGVARAAGAVPGSLPVPWEQLGTVPVVVICGGAPAARRALAEQVAAQQSAPLLDAGFDAARAALCDPQATVIVLALESHDLITRGCPVDRCTASVILAMPDDALPPGAGVSPAEQARALGVPMLLSERLVLLNAADPAIAALAAYAPCRVAWLSDETDWAATAAIVGAVLH